MTTKTDSPDLLLGQVEVEAIDSGNIPLSVETAALNLQVENLKKIIEDGLRKALLNSPMNAATQAESFRASLEDYVDSLKNHRLYNVSSGMLACIVYDLRKGKLKSVCTVLTNVGQTIAVKRGGSKRKLKIWANNCRANNKDVVHISCQYSPIPDIRYVTVQAVSTQHSDALPDTKA